MIDRPLRPIAKELIADLQRWFPQDRSGTPTPPDTFEIGLVLAGGQSAGSYLAGVLDFLFCALNSWREALHRGGDDIPNHNVTVKVIVGASAGGLNAALAAISARYRFDYAMETAFDARAKNLGSPFYRAWVSDIDISNLLATGDLREGGEAATLLNSAYLRGKVGEYIGFTGRGSPSRRHAIGSPIPCRSRSRRRTWTGCATLSASPRRAIRHTVPMPIRCGCIGTMSDSSARFAPR